MALLSLRQRGKGPISPEQSEEIRKRVEPFAPVVPALSTVPVSRRVDLFQRVQLGMLA